MSAPYAAESLTTAVQRGVVRVPMYVSEVRANGDEVRVTMEER